MDEVERLTVELPAEAVIEAQAAVEAGEFPSLDAAVVNAVEAWSADRMIDRIGIETLRRHFREGLASGPSRPLDFDEFKARLTRALAAAKANA